MKNLLYQNTKLIGNSLKQLRIRDEFTLDYVSSSANISLATLSNIENSKFIPKWENLKSILVVYKLSLAQFIYLIYPELKGNTIVYKNEDKILLAEIKDNFSLYLQKPLKNVNDIEQIELEIESLKSSCNFNLENCNIIGMNIGKSTLIEFKNDEQELKEGDLFEINNSNYFSFRNLDYKTCKILLSINPPMF